MCTTQRLTRVARSASRPMGPGAERAGEYGLHFCFLFAKNETSVKRNQGKCQKKIVTGENQDLNDCIGDYKVN